MIRTDKAQLSSRKTFRETGSLATGVTDTFKEHLMLIGAHNARGTVRHDKIKDDHLPGIKFTKKVMGSAIAISLFKIQSGRLAADTCGKQ